MVQTLTGIIIKKKSHRQDGGDLDGEHRENECWFIHKGTEATKESVGEC